MAMYGHNERKHSLTNLAFEGMAISEIKISNMLVLGISGSANNSACAEIISIHNNNCSSSGSFSTNSEVTAIFFEFLNAAACPR